MTTDWDDVVEFLYEDKHVSAVQARAALTRLQARMEKLEYDEQAMTDLANEERLENMDLRAQLTKAEAVLRRIGSDCCTHAHCDSREHRTARAYFENVEVGEGDYLDVERNPASTTPDLGSPPPPFVNWQAVREHAKKVASITTCPTCGWSWHPVNTVGSSAMCPDPYHTPAPPKETKP